jgi:hypothetical protein
MRNLDPDGEINQTMTRDNDRAIFTAKISVGRRCAASKDELDEPAVTDQDRDDWRVDR